MSPLIYGGPGAGFLPSRNVGQAVYNASGAQLTYTGNANLHLAWDYAQGDTGLMSLTVPSLPAPTVAGVYAITASLQFTPAVAPQSFFVTLGTDQDFYGTALTQSAGGHDDDNSVTVTQAWFCSVASGVDVFFRSTGDGTLSGVTLTVQRVT